MSGMLEQKLINEGDTVVKIIRVTEGGIKNKLLGNIMISTKHITDGNMEMFSVRIQPLKVISRNADSINKLSINKFEAVINHKNKTITLGPPQGIQIEEALRNRGIGCYAFNELITALKRVSAEYNFEPYEIALPETTDDDYKEMLTAFLARFNIIINFSNLDKHNVVIRPTPPQYLINYYNPNKVSEINVEDYIFQLFSDKFRMESETNSLKSEVERMSQDTFNGIPKSQLIKYTLIFCFISLFVVFLMVFN